jgi:hypothetical protein
MASSIKYQRPDFLPVTVKQVDYGRWLRRKAIAHVRRDKVRRNKAATSERYRVEIHRAVVESRGMDYYTGERLKWSLIGKYRNAESKAIGRDYKRRFGLLPTVDHFGHRDGDANFRICAWRTNDAKSDLTYLEFLVLCHKVLQHRSRRGR